MTKRLMYSKISESFTKIEIYNKIIFQFMYTIDQLFKSHKFTFVYRIASTYLLNFKDKF